MPRDESWSREIPLAACVVVADDQPPVDAGELGLGDTCAPAAPRAPSAPGAAPHVRPPVGGYRHEDAGPAHSCDTDAARSPDPSSIARSTTVDRHGSRRALRRYPHGA